MATPDPSGTGSAREEAERLVAAVLARASEGASQAAWMAQGAKFAARASGHETTSAGLGLLGDALRGVAKTASGFSEDLHKHSEGTAGGRATARPPKEPTSASGPAATTTAAPRTASPAAPHTQPASSGTGPASSGTGPASSRAEPGASGAGPDAPGAVPAGDASSARARDGRVFAADGPQASHAGWATGSAECCVCPVCRAITMVRNPTPEFAEQLATSAGDLAAGVAGLLRAFSTAAADRTTWSATADSGAAAGSGAAGSGAAGSGAAGSGAAGAGAGSGGTSSGVAGSSTAGTGAGSGAGGFGAAGAGAGSGGTSSGVAGSSMAGTAGTGVGSGAGAGSGAGGSEVPGGAKAGEKAPHEDSGTGWPGDDPWSAATRAAAAGNGGGDPGSSGAAATGDHERGSRGTV
ncbi:MULTISPECIES: hypothetical protein [Catenuloplanes]|uniref:Uncharacterized protein n=1 Tax=Catenuloplanes niger TaxID=587534 RepID=A0AAE3ZN39_9ACTN|nr:hypothetical protein [Catenuloplanes niger]MDR7321665.1 hypothetical protein [Catenuloplanes niger]